MDRRQFIKSSSILTLPIILQSCDWLVEKPAYDIIVHSDANTGHLMRKARDFAVGTSLQTETVIVGGGIAGLTAACQIQNQDFLLFELSDRLGGSSASASFEDVSFSQGAHYDLEYPEGYGTDVLSFMEKLDIVAYHPWSNAWSFKDREHIIFNRSKNKCFDHGEFRKEVLTGGALKDQFLAEIMRHKRKMHLPTRLITGEQRALNDLSFEEYLNQKMSLTPEFVKQLDYHMKDDYGAGAAEVSALAGVHYFMCRPYYDEIVELFSPPEGNSYFINKMANHLPSDQLKTKHLVSKITEVGEGFEMKVIDVESQAVNTITCDQVIYAGQKHALKYTHPESAPLFEDQQSAPWMVVNVVVKDELPAVAYWQNEMLTEDESFMGFVDSATQQRENKDWRVLTGYYCLPVKSRKDLLNVEANKSMIADKTIKHLSNYFEQDISALVREVHVKVMGHAMPIPKPGYLLQDKNEIRPCKKMVYAGVDNGRLPLLYEAIDSGLVADGLLSQLKI